MPNEFNIKNGFITSGNSFVYANVNFGASGTGLFWNNTNNRLGIGTSTPNDALHVIGGGIFSSAISISGGFTMTEASNVHTFTAPATNRTIRFITNSQSYSLFPTGNLTIGTTTDAGYKLDVNGTARVIGNFNPNANINLHSTGSSIKTIDAYWGGDPVYGLNIQGNASSIQSSNGIVNNYIVRIGSGFSVEVSANNEYDNVRVATNAFNPTSGNSRFNLLSVVGVINQTGGANGITRGLYVNTTLTSAADFRAIETTVGNVILNGTSGNTIIGKTSNSGQKLQVNGDALIQSGLTATTISVSGTKGTVTTSGSSTTAFIEVTGSNTVGGTGYTDFIRVTNTAAGATTPTKTLRVNNTGGVEIMNNAYTAVALSITDNGILNVGGGNIATTTSSDGTSNYLSFNANNSQIYDDGNLHIHSRAVNQSMWINTNGGQLNLLTQSPTSTGGIGSGIAIATGTLNGYVTINTGRTVTTAANYGYLTTAGAGTYPGGSQSVVISLYANNRIWGQEIDAFSDERMKNIEGEISLEDGIKLVKNLIPIKYTWKEGDDKGVKAGYSAQQVIKSGFDHLIGLIPTEGLEETIDEDGFLSPKDTQFAMNYDQVTPYHGVVIKHLLEEIEKLKQEIEILKNK